LDTLNPAIGWGSEMIRTMARKNYSEEFRRQAVDLYESTPGATLRGIAADLGIERATLARWVELYGSGKKTTADGATISSSSSGARRRKTPTGAEPEPETPEARIARLEAENAQLRAEQTKLTTEREILRQAAKYFAGETNW
jgi:transposase